MKSVSVVLYIILSTLNISYSQVIEDFEDETSGTYTFSLNGINFITTGDLMIGALTGVGCEESDKYLDTGWGNGGSSGSYGSISRSNARNKFSVATDLSWCILLSANDGENGATGQVKFIGTLDSGETIEETFLIVHSTGSQFDNFQFSEKWKNQGLTRLEISQVDENINYVTLDNISFDNIGSTNVSETHESKILLYPNPATQELAFKGVNNAKVFLYDEFNRLVLTDVLKNQRIDISFLNDGLYFINIQNKNIQINKAFIKF